jgi:glyoxylase-like metal-dependent hydrolase (beta-lactamase superfamily II)
MGSTIEHNGQRIPTFTNARYLMMQAEWDHAAQHPHPTSAFSTHLAILKNHQCLQLINGTYDITPGIQIIPSPGESPGHAIVRLTSLGQVALYMGDLFPIQRKSHIPIGSGQAEIKTRCWTPAMH